MRYRMRPFQVGIAGGFALALAFGTLAAPILASDGDALVERADTTYRLLPEDGVVHVDSRLTLTNKSKPTTRRGPCKNGKGTCTITTRYYFTGWKAWWTPTNALGAQISGPKVEASPPEEYGGGLAYGISFPRLWNKKGAHQKAAFAFDVPAGTVESADDPTRIEDGYAYFCYWGMAGDTGTTKAILPLGWEPVGRRDDIVVEHTADGVVLRARSKQDPSAFIHCVEAVEPDRLDRTYVTGAAGKSLVVIETWPTDPAWAEDMRAIVSEALPNLETLLGSTMPSGELRVREVATQSRRYIYGDLRPTDGILGMGEDAAARFLPSRLAHMWLDRAQFTDTWLSEGLAEWLATQVASDAACGDAGQYPGSGLPDLDAWAEVTSSELVPLGNWQQAAACELVGTAADLIGPDRMVELIVELIDAPVPVGTSHWLAGVSRDLPDGLEVVIEALDAVGVDH